MRYTVKQLSELAGVSVRTLHHYDAIDLLKPAAVGANGYRYYDDAAALRLQQILFFREMDLSLNEIKAILEMPGFDLLAALHAHKDRLHARKRRLGDLIQTIDNTISYLTGGLEMSKKQLFEGFNKDDEMRYYQEARERWGAERVDESYKLWNSYSAQKQTAIKEEGGAIYRDMIAVMESGQAPTCAEAQQIVARWHQHMRHFYEPPVELLRGLGTLYNDDPRFAETFRKMHPDLAVFMREAINHYCDAL